MTDYFSYLLLEKSTFKKEYLHLRGMPANSERHSEFFVTARKEHCKQLASLLVSRVSCLSPWAREFFSTAKNISNSAS